jgi:hypothetical protein
MKQTSYVDFINILEIEKTFSNPADPTMFLTFFGFIIFFGRATLPSPLITPWPHPPWDP